MAERADRLAAARCTAQVIAQDEQCRHIWPAYAAVTIGRKLVTGTPAPALPCVVERAPSPHQGTRGPVHSRHVDYTSNLIDPAPSCGNAIFSTPLSRVRFRTQRFRGRVPVDIIESMMDIARFLAVSGLRTISATLLGSYVGLFLFMTNRLGIWPGQLQSS
jgi:hypothetical protein